MNWFKKLNWSLIVVVIFYAAVIMGWFLGCATAFVDDGDARADRVKAQISAAQY